MTEFPDGGRKGHGCCGRGGRGKGLRILLEPAILASLGAQSAHGYDLRKTIEHMTGGTICADPGGLYRELRRLEDEGLVTSRWAEGESGPQRREYELTEEGRALLAYCLDALRDWESAYHSVIAAIEETLGERGSPGTEKRKEE